MANDPTPSFVDRAFPFMVGHRTQFIALGVGIVRALAMFGVVSNDVANMVEDLALPAGAITIAAKMDRVAKKTATDVTQAVAPVAKMDLNKMGPAPKPK